MRRLSLGDCAKFWSTGQPRKLPALCRARRPLAGPGPQVNLTVLARVCARTDTTTDRVDGQGRSTDEEGQAEPRLVRQLAQEDEVAHETYASAQDADAQPLSAAAP
jgi:hypothetical protein